MGELKMLYAAADVAFVGGSMVPVGGHNILEAAAVGVPVMFGPAMTNFKEIAQGVLAKQAAMQCQNQAELISVLLALSQQPQLRQQLVARASEFLQDNQGAMDRIFAKLRIHLQDNVIQ
jgi:3-deoxy-D-manno-octulosonic-acid transferase